LRWTIEGRGGALGVFLLDGVRGIIAPAWQVNASYKDELWFANISVMQAPSPNVFGGIATINDQIMARAALPLTRSELYFLTGYGAYMLGRISSAEGTTHAYDTIMFGGTLTARSPRHPFFASLDYVYSDLYFRLYDIHSRRQLLMLNVGGTLIFGKGQPSPFRGLL
jgi:hypothetical protein